MPHVQGGLVFLVAACASVLSLWKGCFDGSDGAGQVGGQLFHAPNRPGAWAAAAVRRAEGLVQVKVQHIDTQSAGLGDPQNGIKVGSIAVEQATATVDQISDLIYVLLEQPQRVGIGQHQADNGVVAYLLQRIQIHIPSLVRRDLHDIEAAHAGGSRVGAVGRVRNQDFVALRLTLVIEIPAHHQHAGHFAVRAGRWLE